jgi:hypothetical protein
MADERDTFEFVKSTLPQGITRDKPMTSVNFNYVNDINQSIYTNSNLTLVQYDLTSLYNSSALMNTADMFLVIPTVTCAILTNAANPVGVLQSPACFGLVTPKNFSSSIVHQVDFAVDGKTISQLQPYSNIMYGLDQASALSQDDIILNGRLKGASTQLDNPNSQIYTGRYGAGNGLVASAQGQADPTLRAPLTSICNPSAPGIANNVPFAPNSAVGNGNVVGSVASSQQVQPGVQNAWTINGSITEKTALLPNINGVAGSQAQNNIYGTIVTQNNLLQEFKPYSVYNQTTNVMTWYDFLTIRLSDILPAFNNIGLMRKFNAVLRVYINTGLISVSATPVSANATNRAYLQMTFGGLLITWVKERIILLLGCIMFLHSQTSLQVFLSVRRQIILLQLVVGLPLILVNWLAPRLLPLPDFTTRRMC